VLGGNSVAFQGTPYSCAYQSFCVCPGLRNTNAYHHSRHKKGSLAVIRQDRTLIARWKVELQGRQRTRRA
jgi:hypothetical protein